MNGVEIERVWVLSSMPSVPEGAERWDIEQGYLPGNTGDPLFAEGRIRRVRSAGGDVVCTHTVKRGAGLVREEHERTITPDEFAAHWPSTQGRRIAKTRFRIRDGGLTWELDRFSSLQLVMLEVELPDAAAPCQIPSWAAPFIEREVTFDPRFRNAALAIDGLPADVA